MSSYWVEMHAPIDGIESQVSLVSYDRSESYELVRKGRVHVVTAAKTDPREFHLCRVGENDAVRFATRKAADVAASQVGGVWRVVEAQLPPTTSVGLFAD